MWRDASEASSTARPFRSSSLPRRLVGVQSRISSPAVSSVARVIFEGKKPGQIAFTVMPCSPHSAASARVKFDQAALGGVVGDGAHDARVLAHQAGDRGDVDDAAPLRRDHRALADELREHEHAGEVHVHELVPGFERMILGRRAPGGAGVVHQDVDLAESLQHCSGDRRDGFALADVADIRSSIDRRCFRWETASSSSSFLRAVIATLAPISPSASAICSPRPREPPVTSAFRPLRLRRSRTFIPSAAATCIREIPPARRPRPRGRGPTA